MADKKFGAYICTGCGIGERLNTSQLENVAKREGKMGRVKQHNFLCNQEGVALIQADIDGGEVTHMIIAACSKRAKTDAFDFENVAMSRANLREGVIWVRPDNEAAQETTQEMAEDYIRMACAEVKYMNLPGPSEEQGRTDHLLVVGGGISGLTAALEAANAGYQVTLVERNDHLGGMAAQLYKRIPNQFPFAEPQDTGIDELIQHVEANKRIKVHLNATIADTSGAPGRFQVSIESSGGSSVSETVGAIVQASGFKPYDAKKLPEFAYGKTPDVVDQAGLEALARQANGGAIKRPSDGKAVEKVLFIQCAGQRSNQEGHLSYCSGHCCLTSVKQALYFKAANPDIDTVVLYTELRMPGAGGENFYRSGQERGVIFTKGIASEVVAESGNLNVKFKDLILDEDVNYAADLVVLATGMIPNSGIDI
ncbi:MAG: FAD-dependent oxidoreductase, partial [Pseudomonadota bacterium]|nr:FAD-dependent oxidoreductase [Pseudomonadota bacterium]